MADEEMLREYLKKATAELQQSRRQLAALAARETEPVAVIGIGCRFPGAVRSPQQLWDLVEAGRDVVAPLPQDRGWPLEGPLANFQGGFLSDVSHFDAAFFGISDEEARAMDPQQRLLLETAWEAIERAGVDPATLHGTKTGVYTGLTFTGYPMVLGGNPPPVEVLDYMGVGSSSGAAAGRISYLFGLLGPALSVDTACSSSLVALHVATQALRRGECTMALAGGASVCALPHLFLEFERRGSISATGRSKSFAAAADGVSFAEGVGMLLLERLSDARANGHPVLALIRGTAVNQDGATNGLASPSHTAQERVIRAALADARVTADQVDAVEGHGVGATLGDGIEASALIGVYGQDRPADRPVRLSSVKSNIGHTQAAGGIAGVIKTVMALRNRTFPASLHVDQPTTHADWSAGTVKLMSEAEPWPAVEYPRRAGVSCFSISGTNSHLILEEAPELDSVPETVPEGEASQVTDSVPAEVVGGAVPWLISAKSAPALRAQAERLAAVVGTGEQTGQVGQVGQAELADVGYSLATSRSTFKYRAVIVAAAREEFLAGLAALAAGKPAPGLTTGVARAQSEVALLLPAVDDWAPGTGAGLYESFGTFAQAFDEVCDQLELVSGHPVAGRAGIVAGTGPEQLEQGSGQLTAAEREEVAFAVQVALVRLAESFDATADLVAGQGIGEVTAAHAAGALSLPDACALVAARGRLLAPGDVTEPRPASDFDDLYKVVDGLTFAEPEIPVVSAHVGRAATNDELRSGEHWAGQLVRPGQLDDALAQSRSEGNTQYLTLSAGVGSFTSERAAFLAALGELHAHGVAVNWAPAFDRLGARIIDLPTYPFQYRRYWLTALPDQPDVPEPASAAASEDVELIPGFGQRRMGGFKELLAQATADTDA